MIGGDTLRATLVGFVGAFCAFAIAIWLVGLNDILAALSMADPPVLLVVVAVAACWLTAWGMSLRTVLGALVTATTGISLATVAAAVLIHRGATYVFPTIVGGGTAAVLTGR